MLIKFRQLLGEPRTSVVKCVALVCANDSRGCRGVKQGRPWVVTQGIKKKDVDVVCQALQVSRYPSAR